MIFVTVGTHEQQFNRLIKYIDCLKKDEIINENVIIQTGFSTYNPKYCIWSKIFPYQEMLQKIIEARIVITHGGPSSFIMALQNEKIPIVVPRQKQFGEHINNHQIDFTKKVAEYQKNIIVVEKIENLKNVILNYNTLISSMSGRLKENNDIFNNKFEIIINDLFKKKK